MVVITLSAIAVQLAELQTHLDRPNHITFAVANGNGSVTSETPTRMEPDYFWVADFLFVLFTLVELTLKVSPLWTLVHIVLLLFGHRPS